MVSRLTTTERIAGIAALAGVAASFLTWYGYADGAAEITVNGFRASLLGDVFFIATALSLLIIAARARLIGVGHLDPRVLGASAAVAASAALAAAVLAVTSGHSLHKGLLAAILASAVMVIATRRSADQHARSDSFN